LYRVSGKPTFAGTLDNGGGERYNDNRRNGSKEVYRMDDSYICDDRDVYETVKRIRTMTDEEFEAYLKSLKTAAQKKGLEVIIYGDTKRKG
jgi:hypothetical protein